MDIFKMANQIANNMSAEDKNSMENMDMEKMISHVTKNIFSMMNGMNGMPQPSNESTVPSEQEEDTTDSESDASPIYPKTRDICFDLNVDLEDFYTGKKKKLNVKRKRTINQKIVEEKKKLIIPIERGMKDEQQIKFDKEADQIPGYKTGDIIINLIENEHPDFQRDGDNLIVIKNINLYQIYDLTFDIKHLDGRILRITKEPGDALHLNESLRKITGEGMPIYKKPGMFGDLFIRFNIVIPKSIEKDKMESLKDIFSEQTEEPVLEEEFTQICVLENVTELDLEILDTSSSNYTSDSESETEYSESSSSSEEIVVRRRKS